MEAGDLYTALRMRFWDNREKFPTEQLAAYGGHTVAWWPDGTRIIDADRDGVALAKRLLDGGHDVSFYVYERIDFPGESYV
jgi:hypothetical protein